MSAFQLTSEHQPSGDQPAAIAALVEGLDQQVPYQTLLGVTGSGKTFTMAQVINQVQRPALVLAHNKTLAAQLYGELKALFPENAVAYFVSYYDYYQPEAYVPSTDTFIEKDARINEEIDRLRHLATRSLLERRDVIIVASVSCIYGIGSPEVYQEQLIDLKVGMELERRELLHRLVALRYERNDLDFHRGTFRVRGDTVDIFPIHEEANAIRLSFFGDELEEIISLDPLRGKKLEALGRAVLYPATHYMADEEALKRALVSIEEELEEQLAALRAAGKLLEAQRLEQRTRFDLDALRENGFCSGIENYSRHMSGAEPGSPPPCLLDYFPDDGLVFIDESHAMLPQLRGMYKGDRSRKLTLVEHGFRLPSALDNRPLRFEEFQAIDRQTIYVSATPGELEIDQSEGVIVEQLIRPTGLVDPPVEVRPALEQVDDLLAEIRASLNHGHRVLVTTLTKRMAEELCEYYRELGLPVRYLHSEIDTIERSALLRDLRLGRFDILVGINLLREGLDLPEVGLVAILDADKEGFLRNRTSLIQTIGRAARNAEGKVILYADRVTGSMAAALEETERRREAQVAYNEEHQIIPKTVYKAISDLGESPSEAAPAEAARERGVDWGDVASLADEIERLRDAMLVAAEQLDFEHAATLRDELQALEARRKALSGGGR
ncbi:MAG: excinuclease ABC subunit UvrB [Myxococcota bacterium]|nr:excinuclease ABC subunit UvrB [Myxococcota bacterium]